MSPSLRRLLAQSNCRATVEALAYMQNPPTVFARQANIASGPQQINNGVEGRIASSLASIAKGAQRRTTDS